MPPRGASAPSPANCRCFLRVCCRGAARGPVRAHAASVRGAGVRRVLPGPGVPAAYRSPTASTACWPCWYRCWSPRASCRSTRTIASCSSSSRCSWGWAIVLEKRTRLFWILASLSFVLMLYLAICFTSTSPGGARRGVDEAPRCAVRQSVRLRRSRTTPATRAAAADGEEPRHGRQPHLGPRQGGHAGHGISVRRGVTPSSAERRPHRQPCVASAASRCVSAVAESSPGVASWPGVRTSGAGLLGRTRDEWSR